MFTSPECRQSANTTTNPCPSPVPPGLCVWVAARPDRGDHHPAPAPAPAPALGSCDDLVRENHHLQGRAASSGSWRLATGLLPQLLSTIMRAACTDIYSEVTLMVRWYNDILEWSSTLTPKVGALLAACRRLDTCTQSPPSTVKMSGSIAMTICTICDQ